MNEFIKSIDGSRIVRKESIAIAEIQTVSALNSDGIYQNYIGINITLQGGEKTWIDCESLEQARKIIAEL